MEVKRRLDHLNRGWDGSKVSFRRKTGEGGMGVLNNFPLLYIFS